MGAAPRRLHRISAAARQKSGMPMTSGNSFAFQGQSSALKTPHPDSSRMPVASVREARLCTNGLRARPTRLDDGVADDPDGDGEKHQDHRSSEPRSVVTRNGDVEVVLGDLAE